MSNYPDGLTLSDLRYINGEAEKLECSNCGDIYEADGNTIDICSECDELAGVIMKNWENL